MPLSLPVPHLEIKFRDGTRSNGLFLSGPPGAVFFWERTLSGTKALPVWPGPAEVYQRLSGEKEEPRTSAVFKI